MKRVLCIGLMISSLVASAATAAPPASPSTQSPPRQGGGRGGDRMMGYLTTRLKLTDAQAAKMQPLLKSYNQKGWQRKQAERQQMQTILTPEQMAQMDAMRKQRGQERGKRGQGSSGQDDDGQGNGSGQRGGGRGGSMAQLNLTDDQRAQMKTLKQKNRQQRQADQQALFAQSSKVLDASQETQFEQIVGRGGRGHGHRGQGGQGQRGQWQSGQGQRGQWQNGQGQRGQWQNGQGQRGQWQNGQGRTSGGQGQKADAQDDDDDD